MLTLLEPTELRLYTSETDVERFAQGEGYMQVTGDHVLVLVEEAIRPGDLDAADLRERLRTAQERPSARRTAPRSSAWPSATRAAGRRSSSSPRAARASPPARRAGPRARRRRRRRRPAGAGPSPRDATSGVAARPPRASGRAAATGGQRRRVERAGHRGAEDDEVGPDAGARLGHGVQGRVRAQEGHLPAAVVQEQREAQQAELVALPGRAGEDRPRPAAGREGPAERPEPAAEQRAGEVLLAHGELPGLPAVPDPGQQGQHDVAQGEVEAARGQEVVEGGVGRARVERVERRRQRRRAAGRRRGAPGAALERGRPGPGARAGRGAHARGLAARQPRRHLRREALRAQGEHPAQGELLRGVVQALARPRAPGAGEAVAALPGPQRRGLDADTAAELADADAGRDSVVHGATVPRWTDT